jgi:UDP-glucose 4-epimerase
MSTIVLTGSSGRIGSLIAQTLLERGHRVIGLDLAEARLTQPGYSHVRCDFTAPEPVFDAVKGCDKVLHIGAFMSWHPKDNVAMFHANVAATQMLLEAAKLSRVQRFVFASSGEVYPESRAVSLPVTEEHPCNPISFYGESKKLGEDLVRFYGGQGLETTILRFPHTQAVSEILDPDSFFSGPRFFLDAKIRQMEFFGNTAMATRLRALNGTDGVPKMLLQYGEADGLPYMMHIADARDTAAGVLLAMDHPAAANQVFNLGPDDVVEFDKVLPVMAERMGMPLVKAMMAGPAVRFRTSTDKIKTMLGYQPQHSFLSMVEEAARLRRAGA